MVTWWLVFAMSAKQGDGLQWYVQGGTPPLCQAGGCGSLICLMFYNCHQIQAWATDEAVFMSISGQTLTHLFGYHA